jgi:hypothetical protein
MSMTIEERNQMLRQAVVMRREAQAAGRPHEEWYDESQPATEPAAPVAETEQMKHFREYRAYPMTPDELDDALERLRGDGIQHEQQPGSLPFLELLEELRSLHLSKSQDYGSQSDPLANIRQGAEFVGIEAWRGCMVRVADKVQRLKTYCRTGRLVHEGVRDTLLDLAAYSLLAIVLFDEGRESSNGVR